MDLKTALSIFSVIIYLFSVSLLLIFLILVSFLLISFIYSSLKGSPYVASQAKIIEDVFRKIKLKKNSLFIDLGCGDGRVVILAVKKFGVFGIGYDINPLLIFFSKFKAKISGLTPERVSFFVADIRKVNINHANYIYLFLMPNLIEEISPKFLKLKKKTIIISHGFKISRLKRKLFKTFSNNPFPTYVYKI